MHGVTLAQRKYGITLPITQYSTIRGAFTNSVKVSFLVGRRSLTNAVIVIALFSMLAAAYIGVTCAMLAATYVLFVFFIVFFAGFKQLARLSYCSFQSLNFSTLYYDTKNQDGLYRLSGGTLYS